MMKARHISYLIACMIMLCCLNTQAQNAFPYPALPDTLRSVEQRATYLSEHYWDNYQFADTTQRKTRRLQNRDSSTSSISSPVSTTRSLRKASAPSLPRLTYRSLPRRNSRA